MSQSPEFRHKHGTTCKANPVPIPKKVWAVGSRIFLNFCLLLNPRRKKKTAFVSSKDTFRKNKLILDETHCYVSDCYHGETGRMSGMSWPHAHGPGHSQPCDGTR